jgi:hypothetical protein
MAGQFSGQRAKKPHLVRGGGGLAGEVADLRDDIEKDFAANDAVALEEFVDPIAADPDGIVLSQASVAAPVSLSGAALDGALAGGPFSPPRNVTVSTAGVTPATMDVTGTDVDGNALLETITVAQTATIAAGVKAFATVTQIDFPAADGTAALLEVGIGEVFGLAKPIKSLAGLASLDLEVEAGSKVTTGTVVDAATSPPNGSYEPSTVADASNDYAIKYEYDASTNG